VYVHYVPPEILSVLISCLLGKRVYSEAVDVLYNNNNNTFNMNCVSPLSTLLNSSNKTSLSPLSRYVKRAADTLTASQTNLVPTESSKYNIGRLL